MLLFRGRLRPNIQRDPAEPLEVFFTRPRGAEQLITVKIKELDTYTDLQNRQVSEGSEDDLLATFTGRIINTGPDAAARRFRVETHSNESNDESLPTIKIKFEGTDTVYDIPVVSEEGESEGSNWEIAFTVEYPGQDDYNSPVSYIARAHGSLLVVDNTTSDLSEYDAHANLLRNHFVSKEMQGKIIRGGKSNTATAHYHAADTDHYYGGYDINVFARAVMNHDYIVFNSHGYVSLEDTLGAVQGDPCNLCAHRFSHNEFSGCRRDRTTIPVARQCKAGDRRGFFFFTPRTAENLNAEIDLDADSGEWLNFRLNDSIMRVLVDGFVDWEEYGEPFFNANDQDTDAAGIQNPLITTNPATPRMIDGIEFPGAETYNLQVPNRFTFPTLSAFPANNMRPDFSEDNLRRDGENLVQDPPSSDLHAGAAGPVPGIPVVCFMGEGAPLSNEASTTPAVGANDVLTPSANTIEFSATPANLQVKPRDGRILLTWEKVRGAESYTLYWSTSPNIRESDVSNEECLNINAIHNIYESEALSRASAAVNAAPADGNAAPAVPAAGAATAFGAPEGVQAQAGNGEVLISWNPVQGAESYILQAAVSADFGTGRRVIRNIQTTHHRDTGLLNGTAFHYGVNAVIKAATYNHTGRSNGTQYYYRVRAIKPAGYLTPSQWSGMGDLSHVKVVYAECCLTGRKTVFADAVLAAGAKFFIGHQVVSNGNVASLASRFWQRWLDRGAILRNLINIYNEVLRTSQSFRRTRPVVYFRNNAGETQFWRYGEDLPTDIKVD